MGQKKKYNFSFTGAAAMISETILIADEFQHLKEWDKVKEYVERNNLLNKIKKSTFEREFREIRKRIEKLTPQQREVLCESGREEAKQVIFLAIIKMYPYIHDFVVEVLLNKWLVFDRVLQEHDYNTFFNTKTLIHPELESLTDSTSNKVKQRVFRILEETGIISNVKDGIILKPVLNESVERSIIQDNPDLLFAFLYAKDDIIRILKKEEYA